VIAVPENFKRQYAEREGESGQSWIDSLPGIVGELAQRWDLTLGETVESGHVGLVVLAHWYEMPVALKVSYPYPDTVHEGDVLAAWRGDGAVRLIDQDRRHSALLMERAGGSLETEPLDDAISVIASLWSRLHVHVPPAGLASTNSAARQWITSVPAEWSYLADDLQSDSRVLLHGDLHYENVLRSTREPWLAIDPKCFVGDPCFEAVAPLWNRLDEIVGDRDDGIRSRHLQICDAAGLDVIRAAKWSILHALEEGDSNEIVPALSALL